MSRSRHAWNLRQAFREWGECKAMPPTMTGKVKIQILSVVQCNHCHATNVIWLYTLWTIAVLFWGGVILNMICISCECMLLFSYVATLLAMVSVGMDSVFSFQIQGTCPGAPVNRESMNLHFQIFRLLKLHLHGTCFAVLVTYNTHSRYTPRGGLWITAKTRQHLKFKWCFFQQGLALLTLSWDKNWDSHSLVNGYPSFYPRIALVAPSPGGYSSSYIYTSHEHWRSNAMWHKICERQQNIINCPHRAMLRLKIQIYGSDPFSCEGTVP